MSFDAATLIIGVAAGGVAGLGISYVSFYPSGNGRKVKAMQRDETGQLRKKMVTTEDLESSRREMRTLLLERDLLSAALTKVYEAENEGKITREEREMIAKRYSSQIRDLESKLRDKELIVEVGELEGLRDELMTLFREKIQNIETQARPGQGEVPQPHLSRRRRRRQRRSRRRPLRATRAGRQGNRRLVARPRPPGRPRTLERVVERKSPKRDDTEGERRVRAIRDEVMEALEKLEQIDSRKENEGT